MISNDDLLALSSYLSRFITLHPHTLVISGCDDTLRYTLAWLGAQNCNRQLWLCYLHACYGYCDCEVVLRVVAPVHAADTSLPVASVLYHNSTPYASLTQRDRR